MPRERLYQKAVLWVANGVDANGEPVFTAPVEIDTRWEERRGQTVGPAGTAQVIDATIWVDRVVTESSVLWLGELRAWVNNGTQPLMRVIYYEAVPDIKGRRPERSVGAVRFRGLMPETI